MDEGNEWKRVRYVNGDGKEKQEANKRRGLSVDMEGEAGERLLEVKQHGKKLLENQGLHMQPLYNLKINK